MKHIRLGIMSYAHVHAPQYIPMLQAMEGVELVGLADDDCERAQEAARDHDVRIFGSYTELLEQKLDAVIVTSENSRHRQHVELAAAAGVDILCEKPMATRAEDAAAMLEVCEAHGVQLMVAFPMRYSEPMHEIHGLLASGTLGRVRACEGVNQGQIPQNRRSWFVDPVLAGGGAVMDHTVHVADALRWLLNDDVVEVYAQANNTLGNGSLEVETSGLVVLTFASGVVATVDCSWNRPMTFPAWGGLGIRFVADHGVVDVDAYSERLMSYDDSAGKISAIDCSQSAYRTMLAHFIDVVRGQAPASPTGLDGFRAAQIVDAAYESIQSGQPVSCKA